MPLVTYILGFLLVTTTGGEQRSFVIYRRNTYEQYGGYNLFQNAEFLRKCFNKSLKKMLSESCVMFFRRPVLF